MCRKQFNVMFILSIIAGSKDERRHPTVSFPARIHPTSSPDDIIPICSHFQLPNSFLYLLLVFNWLLSLVFILTTTKVVILTIIINNFSPLPQTTCSFRSEGLMSAIYLSSCHNEIDGL